MNEPLFASLIVGLSLIASLVVWQMMKWNSLKRREAGSAVFESARLAVDALSNLEFALPALVAWAVWGAFGRKRKVSWLRSYGASRGLQPSPDSALRGTMPSEQGMLHGVWVMVTCSASNRDPLTRVAAAVPHQKGRVQVSRGWASWENMPGLRDVHMGDSALGPGFVVKSDSPDVAMRWLTPALRQELQAFGLEQLALSLADGQIAPTWRGFKLEDARALDHGMRIVLTAALGRPLEQEGSV